MQLEGVLEAGVGREMRGDEVGEVGEGQLPETRAVRAARGCQRGTDELRFACYREQTGCREGTDRGEAGLGEVTSEPVAFVLARDAAGMVEMGRGGARASEEGEWLDLVIGWGWERVESGSEGGRTETEWQVA